MISSSSILAVVAFAATAVLAKTPSGFSPSVKTDLVVDYNVLEAMNGVLVAKAATASAPTLATKKKLNGTSFAVLMVDIDVPSGSSNGSTTTFLHWAQTGFTQSASKSTVNTASGTSKAYKLTAASNTSALVAYTQPGPPNKAPTSHRYTQVLLDTSGMSSAQMAVLKSAVRTRSPFSVAQVLSDMGMTANVVAGNSFNVSAVESTTSSSSNNSSSSGSGSGGSGNSGSAKATKTKTKTAAATTSTSTATASAAASSSAASGGANATTNGTTQSATNSTTQAGTSTVATSKAGEMMVGSGILGMGLAVFMCVML